MTVTNKYSQTLDLLSIFHYVLSALIYLKGLFALIMMGVGTIAVAGVLFDRPDDMEVGLVVLGLIFFAAPTLFLCITWAIATAVLFAGRRIAKRTNLTYCQVIAGLECICFPFGTILGATTLIFLAKAEVKESFDSLVK